MISWSCLQKVVSTPRSAPLRARGVLEDVGHDVTAVVTWRGENGLFGEEAVLNALMEPVQRDCLTASFDYISQQRSQAGQKSPDPFISETYSSLCRRAVDSSVRTFQCSSKIRALVSACDSHAKHLADTPRPATCAVFRSVVTRG